LLTKADKLGRQQQARQQDVTQQQLAQFGPRVTAQLFSSVTGDGVNEARTVIVDWLKSHSMGPE
jgi:GTP-binding protein